MISCTRCAGVRSRTLCTVLSNADHASLKKQMITLTDGKFCTYCFSRHLKKESQLAFEELSALVLNATHGANSCVLRSVSRKRASKYGIWFFFGGGAWQMLTVVLQRLFLHVNWKALQILTAYAECQGFLCDILCGHLSADWRHTVGNLSCKQKDVYNCITGGVPVASSGK